MSGKISSIEDSGHRHRDNDFTYGPQFTRLTPLPTPKSPHRGLKRPWWWSRYEDGHQYCL